MNAFDTMVCSITLIIQALILCLGCAIHEKEETIRASFCPHYIERPVEHVPTKAK